MVVESSYNSTTVYLPVLLEPWILSIYDSLLTSYVTTSNVIQWKPLNRDTFFGTNSYPSVEISSDNRDKNLTLEASRSCGFCGVNLGGTPIFEGAPQNEIFYHKFWRGLLYLGVPPHQILNSDL